MKKIFALSVIALLIFSNFVLPCEKANAEHKFGEICYWICSDCGWKVKTLYPNAPSGVQYNPMRDRRPTFHTWIEVDKKTWFEW